MQKPKKRTICAFIAILVLLYIVIRIIPSLTGALTGTETLEYGDLQISDEAKCYIVRNEVVYTAAQDEKLKYLIKEGTQIKKGTTVLEGEAVTAKDEENSSKYYKLVKDMKTNVAPDNAEHTSQMKGVISYYVDGYESYFTFDRLDKIKWDELNPGDIKATDVKHTKAQKGDAIFKITDNSLWYFVFTIDNKKADKYQEGNNVTVQIEDESVLCTVSKVDKKSGDSVVFLETNRYYSGFSKERVVEAKIVTTDLSGILVKSKCITKKDGQSGVYVKNTVGDYNFVPVQILGSDGKTTVVTQGVYLDENGNWVDTVNNYDEVLTNPKKAKSSK